MQEKKYLPALSRASALVCSRAKNLSLYRRRSSLSGSALGQYTLIMTRSSVAPLGILKITSQGITKAEDLYINIQILDSDNSGYLLKSFHNCMLFTSSAPINVILFLLLIPIAFLLLPLTGALASLNKSLKLCIPILLFSLL